MKKSTKFLVGSLFSVAVVFGAGELFNHVGLAFGITETIGAVFAGALGALRLFSGT